MRVRIARGVGRVVERMPWLDVELWSACCAIGWSFLTTISPEPMIDRPFWTFLGQVVSPPFWEVSGIVLGLFQLASLFQPSRVPHYVAALIASMWWALLTVSIVLGDHFAPSIVLYLAMALANLAAMGRAANGGTL